jgi:hypothetical protein
MKIMGTGSRSMLVAPNAKAIYNNLEEEVLRLTVKYPNLTLISGMAEGWDEAIAKVAMRNNIPYSVMIPTKDYGDYYWRRNSLLKVNRMTTFDELISKAAEVIYVSNKLYVDGVHANFIRNQAMVDACDGALVYEPHSRGTQDAVNRLAKANKPMKVYPFSAPADTYIDCECPHCDHIMVDLGACRCHFDGGCCEECISNKECDFDYSTITLNAGTYCRTCERYHFGV